MPPTTRTSRARKITSNARATRRRFRAVRPQPQPSTAASTRVERAMRAASSRRASLRVPANQPPRRPTAGRPWNRAPRTASARRSATWIRWPMCVRQLPQSSLLSPTAPLTACSDRRLAPGAAPGGGAWLSAAPPPEPFPPGLSPPHGHWNTRTRALPARLHHPSSRALEFDHSCAPVSPRAGREVKNPRGFGRSAFEHPDRSSKDRRGSLSKWHAGAKSPRKRAIACAKVWSRR